jgi:tetratricopeptide (TPR) repeat protein
MQVYISYAREDINKVRRIYAGLKQKGVVVWFDEQHLQPGRWRPQLEKAIAQSHYFLLCLSGFALTKLTAGRSALNDEFMTAWEIAKNQTEREFIILPIRLEACDRGDRIISSFQQYDLFPEELFEKRLNSLADKLLGLTQARQSNYNCDALDVEQVANLLTRCEAHLYAGEFDLAIKTVDHLLHLAPNEPRAYHARACAYEGKGELEAAIQDYSRAIELEPKYAIAYNNRGLTYLTKHEVATAIMDFDESIRLDPNAATPYNNRALARKQLNDLNGALADYGHALHLNPYYVGCYVNRALARWQKGDQVEALQDLAEAIQLAPNNDTIYKLRGEMRFVLKDFAGAIADYSEVIRTAPDPRDAYFKRGVAREDSGDVEGALTDYSEAIRLLPTATGYFNRGLLYKKRAFKTSKRDDWLAAISDLEHALEMDPTDIEARETLEICRINLRMSGYN